MKIFPLTMKEQEQCTIRQLLRATVVDRQDTLTNVYTPTYKLLTKLYDWINKNVPDKTFTELEKETE